MEDPQELLQAVLDFAQRAEGVHAVVQTGSRARGSRVDSLSDLDIELVGPGTAALAGEDAWLEQIGPVLVALHLPNEEPDEPGWPTCLAVFAGGRKVDFTLAGPERLERLAREGLDDLYGRGYTVHLDKTGLARGLAPSEPQAPRWEPPDEEDFEDNQREFWFEATQVPVYAARGDLWPAALRLAELRDLLLTMLEWHAKVRSGGAADTWHNGHHLAEWLAEPYRSRLPELFAGYEAADTVRALRALTEVYAEAAAEVGSALGLPVLGLHQRVLRHLDEVMATPLG
ncbi:aminoglycoside 6-adenylyltransferase [Streptomyces boncukensis]|uniref:Aminoglycoside 6-adenylyltransferase n=1 Tax=Streptomyces boncukensis TaxID=2711219 RepID=A0A6G4X0L1_9ACTN|nr:aminoglycoside 6-adenylyltransferase [Streptomyces boncukensis]NGO71089.1 aminoglycoside 6-adenylyltransferase [Streptomyces boncukensis]